MADQDLDAVFRMRVEGMSVLDSLMTRLDALGLKLDNGTQAQIRTNAAGKKTTAAFKAQDAEAKAAVVTYRKLEAELNKRKVTTVKTIKAMADATAKLRTEMQAIASMRVFSLFPQQAEGTVENYERMKKHVKELTNSQRELRRLEISSPGAIIAQKEKLRLLQDEILKAKERLAIARQQVVPNTPPHWLGLAHRC